MKTAVDGCGADDPPPRLTGRGSGRRKLGLRFRSQPFAPLVRPVEGILYKRVGG